MSKNLNELAAWPRTEAEVTAESLARYLTVQAQTRRLELRAAVREIECRDCSTAAASKAAEDLTGLFGLVKALKALQVVAPEVADEVARDLWADWHDGGAVGEWLHAWLVGFGIDPARVDAVAGELAREAA